MDKIVVFGASGQLGQCLQVVSSERNVNNIIFLPEEEASILNIEALLKVFRKHQPTFCINCAAYTAVDKGEDEPALAEAVNVEGVSNLSKLCLENQTTLIHISTDFVFSGDGNKPLSEEDEVNPINVYGVTKLAGERIIPTFLKKHFIIRTSWLYSEYGGNFLKTMLRMGKEREELRVVWDQIGTPTYAIDLASCLLDLIKTENVNLQYGTYHYSNEGLTSWYDFAKAIFEISKISVKVVPVRSSEYITKAPRPKFTVMDKAKIKHNLNLEILHWRESLEKCMNRL